MAEQISLANLGLFLKTLYRYEAFNNVQCPDPSSNNQKYNERPRDPDPPLHLHVTVI